MQRVKKNNKCTYVFHRSSLIKPLKKYHNSRLQTNQLVITYLPNIKYVHYYLRILLIIIKNQCSRLIRYGKLSESSEKF